LLALSLQQRLGDACRARVRARRVVVPISAGTDGQAAGVGVAQEEVGILV